MARGSLSTSSPSQSKITSRTGVTATGVTVAAPETEQTSSLSRRRP
jgi:hypothetical protein